MTAPFSKILIANRGEIACRVISTAKRMGVKTVAVYSDADEHAMHVLLADEAVHIGPSPVGQSYLAGDKIIAAAVATGAQAIHPGYGFLSENPDFVEAVEEAKLVFIGPSALSIRAMGLKDAAKDLMVKASVPVVPGYQGIDQSPELLAAEADRIGYPVLIKARAGGGGKGMRKVEHPSGFHDALLSARREGQSAFGDPHVLIERFISTPRHIEVQIFGDAHGNVVHLFERDCSLQRRHQKVIEEAPAPGMTEEFRAAITDAAVAAARAIDYQGAGTIEFIVDGTGSLRPDGFWFMEMNTRLQVEHPVTEAITGVDLVEWQLRVAAGEPLPLKQEELQINGHSFEARLYAEDPANGFLPVTGKLEHLSFSPRARNDTGVGSGDPITPFYDPMIAKIITHNVNREAALAQLVEALHGTHVAGTRTNKEFLARLASHEGFRTCQFDTGFIERELEQLVSTPGMSDIHLALAAVLGLRIDLSAERCGWRQYGDAVHDVCLEEGAEAYQRRVSLKQDNTLTVTGGAESVTLRSLAADGSIISARVGKTNKLISAQVIRVPQTDGLLLSVLLDGVVRDILLPDPRARAGSQNETGNVVLAPMSGMIVALDVSQGDLVHAGDKLGVMEAMKMETPLVAPCSGRIADIYCSVGDAIEGGATLVTFEKAEA